MSQHQNFCVMNVFFSVEANSLADREIQISYGKKNTFERDKLITTTTFLPFLAANFFCYFRYVASFVSKWNLFHDQLKDNSVILITFISDKTYSRLFITSLTSNSYNSFSFLCFCVIFDAEAVIFRLMKKTFRAKIYCCSFFWWPATWVNDWNFTIEYPSIKRVSTPISDRDIVSESPKI